MWYERTLDFCTSPWLCIQALENEDLKEQKQGGEGAAELLLMQQLVWFPDVALPQL